MGATVDAVMNAKLPCDARYIDVIAPRLPGVCRHVAST